MVWTLLILKIIICCFEMIYGLETTFFRVAFFFFFFKADNGIYMRALVSCYCIASSTLT